MKLSRPIKIHLIAMVLHNDESWKSKSKPDIFNNPFQNNKLCYQKEQIKFVYNKRNGW